jgi:hypothetical protein
MSWPLDPVGTVALIVLVTITWEKATQKRSKK